MKKISNFMRPRQDAGGIDMDTETRLSAVFRGCSLWPHKTTLQWRTSEVIFPITEAALCSLFLNIKEWTCISWIIVDYLSPSCFYKFVTMSASLFLLLFVRVVMWWLAVRYFGRLSARSLNDPQRSCVG